MFSGVMDILGNLFDIIKGFFEFILNLLYWLPYSEEEIKKICLVAFIIGVILAIVDWAFRDNTRKKVSIFCAYLGAVFAFVSSLIVLSWFYSYFGEIEEKDLGFMRLITVGICVVLALESGIISLSRPLACIFGLFAFIAAIPLWFAIALGATAVYYLKDGYAIQPIIMVVLMAIAGAIFGGIQFLYLRNVQELYDEYGNLEIDKL